jgi:hypothetical protein
MRGREITKKDRARDSPKNTSVAKKKKKKKKCDSKLVRIRLYIES